MVSKQHVRFYILFILSLIMIQFSASNLALARIVHSEAAMAAKDESPYSTTEIGGWLEIGAGSASGGGISNNETQSGNPSLAITPDGTPIITWTDGPGYNEIYVRRWDGESWVEMGSGSASGGGISEDNISSTYSSPSLAIDSNGTPIITWQYYDYSAGQYEIYVRRWNGESWVEMGAGSASGGGISNNSGDSKNPSLAINSEGIPIIAWQDESSGAWEIYARGWDGETWVEMGEGSASGGGISHSGDSTEPSLAIDSNGLPIVAWQHHGYYYEMFVRRWDGETWVEMGEGSASDGGVSNSDGPMQPSLAINHEGMPIIAWVEYGIYVRYWNGTSWEEMGEGSASGDSIIDTYGRYPSIAINLDGSPIIAWQHKDNEIYVKEWNGTSWVEKGSGSASGGGISDNGGESHMPSIAVSPEGIPIVAWYNYVGNNTEIYVRHWQPYIPPVADFTGAPTKGGFPLDVQFTNLSTGDYDQCLWDFGDGGTSESCDDPSYIYNGTGVFTVTLTLDGPGGNNTLVKSDYITVLGSANTLEYVAHIGGNVHAVAEQGNYAYIGEGPALAIFDITDLTRPYRVGKTSPMPDIVLDIAILGNYAYVADGQGGLQIFDISDPSAPSEIGLLQGGIGRVVVVNDFAYVTGSNGLQIINISDPSSPYEIGSYYDWGSYGGLAVSGDYAYVAGGNGLLIINIAEPNAPVKVGHLEIQNINDLTVAANYAYVAGEYSLDIIDVSNPAAPVSSGSVDMPGSLRRHLAVNDDFIFVTHSDGGLSIFDISSPTTPKEAGNLDIYGVTTDVTVTGNVAFVASDGLGIIDVSVKTAPTEAGYYHVPISANHVTIAGNYAYITGSSSGGVHIIDISNPLFPIETGFIDPAERTLRLAVKGNYAYATALSEGLRIIDVSNPSQPTEVGYYDTPGSAIDVTLDDNYAYVADARGGLRIVDVSDPTEPKEVGFYDEIYYCFGVAVSRSFAYVAGGGAFQTVSVFDPSSPTQIGSYYELEDVEMGIVVEGDYAYIPDETGLHIIDVSNPAAPEEVGSFDIIDGADGLAIAGNYAFVTHGSTGLSVINVLDPSELTEIAFYNSSRVAWNVDVDRDLVYVADNDGGMVILRFNDPNPPGRILVDKVTNPIGDPQEFHFSLTGGPDEITENFILHDGDNPWASDSLKPGTYILTETVLSLWIQSEAVCDNESDPSNILLDAGETVTCTFTNTKLDPPIADFTALPISGIPPLEVEFTNLSTGDFDQCLWDFGDDITSNSCNDSTHIYDKPGTYEVSLEVQGLGGQDAIAKAGYITVYEPPKADFSASPENGTPPLTVEFTNLSTGDFDQCLWDFGDGETANTCDDPSRRYENEGHYTVSLTVKGLGGEDTKTVEQCVNVAYYRLYLPGVLNSK